MRFNQTRSNPQMKLAELNMQMEIRMTNQDPQWCALNELWDS
jgi:hypothetical protein